DGTLKRVKTRVRVEGSANIHDVAEATVLDELGEKVTEPYLAGGSGLRQQHVGEPEGESAGPFPLGAFEEPYPLFPADGRVKGQLAPPAPAGPIPGFLRTLQAIRRAAGAGWGEPPRSEGRRGGRGRTV